MPMLDLLTADYLMHVAESLFAEGETQRGRTLLASIIDVYPYSDAAQTASSMLQDRPPPKIDAALSAATLAEAGLGIHTHVGVDDQHKLRQVFVVRQKREFPSHWPRDGRCSECDSNRS